MTDRCDPITKPTSDSGTTLTSVTVSGWAPARPLYSRSFPSCSLTRINAAAAMTLCRLPEIKKIESSPFRGDKMCASVCCAMSLITLPMGPTIKPAYSWFTRIHIWALGPSATNSPSEPTSPML